MIVTLTIRSARRRLVLSGVERVWSDGSRLELVYTYGTVTSDVTPRYFAMRDVARIELAETP